MTIDQFRQMMLDMAQERLGLESPRRLPEAQAAPERLAHGLSSQPEWATEKGGGVFPHHCGIVPPAKVMWKVYYEQRADVRYLEMPAELIERCNVRHREPELRCIYEKDPVFLPALEAAGKLLRVS
jgi:hypothetical protein